MAAGRAGGAAGCEVRGAGFLRRRRAFRARTHRVRRAAAADSLSKLETHFLQGSRLADSDSTRPESPVTRRGADCRRSFVDCCMDSFKG